VIAACAVQEQQRGRMAARVLVVEAKTILHHERHRVISSAVDLDPNHQTIAAQA
jgi:hypothetical protein